jgi:two-component system response regulator YesN
MYRLMIVDDEPNIVRSVQDFLYEKSELDLYIFNAFSGTEAWKVIQKSKMDIVICDINMPGMTGLELIQHTIHLWPRCKFIFLTGYDDFDFIQSALRYGTHDYLLKIEPRERILEAVHKAVEHIENEVHMKEVLLKARSDAQKALSLLREKYLLRIIDQEIEWHQMSPSQFSELGIPLALADPVYLFIARIDKVPERYNMQDRHMLQYAICNITEELLGSNVLFTFCKANDRDMIWFLQNRTPQLESSSIFIREVIVDIQKACQQFLETSITVALSTDPLPWESCGNTYGQLRSLLQRGMGLQSEFLTYSPSSDVNAGDNALPFTRITNLLKQCSNGLEMGDIHFFEFHLNSLLNLIDPFEFHPHGETLFLEVKFHLTALFFTQLNRHGNAQVEQLQLKTELVALSSSATSWTRTKQRIQDITRMLFQTNENQKNERIKKIIKDIQEYIQANLSGDLSLVKLADVVFINPAYLSRLYKELTGMNITEYIREARLQKVCELLQQTHLKIHEIATLTGFDSPQYMARIFRIRFNLTPQEYKNRT